MQDVDFGLENKFADAEELKYSWKSTRMPDEILLFFSTLFNIKKTELIKQYYSEDDVERESDDELTDKISFKSAKIGSLFQIIHYTLHNGNKTTPLHIMNACEIYERCKSKELITSFNRSGLCTSYKSMKRHRANLTKYCIKECESNDRKVPLPSHFDRTSFTLLAFDNFDHTDRTTLSGQYSAHDTAITVFQEKPAISVSKPLKSDVDISSVQHVSKLPCQEIIQYKSPRKLVLPEEFKVDDTLFNCPEKLSQSNAKEFIFSLLRSLPSQKAIEHYIESQNEEVEEGVITTNGLPTWAGMRSLLSDTDPKVMQVGFLPFIPYPVTDYSTVYTAMKNFNNIVEQLQQSILPVYCDEGVFRIVLDIFLNRPDEFPCLLPMLGGFHMAKCALHCIWKYISGSGLEDGLVEVGIFGQKVIESVISATNYNRSVKGVLIIESAIEYMKWQAFWSEEKKESFKDVISNIESLKEAMRNKDPSATQQLFKNCESKSVNLKKDFEEFSKTCNNNSEMSQYWDTIVRMIQKLKMLISADRDGDWNLHMQAVQDLLPIFAESDSINYLRYGSWYIEKIRKLAQEHPEIHAKFLEGSFVVRTKPKRSVAVSPDMKLEQTIQRSKKSSGGVIGQTNQEKYITEWEVVYHEILAISNCYNEITQCNSQENDLHHELYGNTFSEINSATDKLINFIKLRGNPYNQSVEMSTQLHNFCTGQLVKKEAASRFLFFEKNANERYESFRRQRYNTKEVKLGETIKKSNMPKFKSTNTTKVSLNVAATALKKKIGLGQRDIDIARSRGVSMKKLLEYDHMEQSVIFEDILTKKPDKSSLVKALEAYLEKTDYDYDKRRDITTCVVVDFMSLIRKISFTKMLRISDIFEEMWKRTSFISQAGMIHMVYDSYIEGSIKDCERLRRAEETEPLEFVNLTGNSPLPVQLNRFWACSKNKENMQILSR